MDEFLAVVKQVWTADEPEFDGEFYQLARSVIYPKPVTTPHPPIYLGAFDERALRRIGRLADGWNPAAAALPASMFGPMMATARDGAVESGRDPDRLEMIVRAHVTLTDQPLDSQRPMFSGTWSQVVDDIRSVHQAGADELFFDCTVTEPIAENRFLDLMDRLLPAAREATSTRTA